MAFTVTTYQFDKKTNSTKRPAAGDVVATYNNVELKDQCSIITPAIKLNVGTTSFTIPNYAYIAEFDRYYFVTDIQFERGIWTIRLKVDVMATWKTQIGAQSLYVTRSASNYDGSIVDVLYPTKTGVEVVKNENALLAWNVSSYYAGTFVVGIAGQSTTYYLFTKSNLDDLFSYLFSDDYADELVLDFATTYPELKTQINPLQFITSIMWLPFITGTPTTMNVRVGYVDVEVVADELPNDAIETITGTFTIQSHPQSGRGSYLNAAPYMRNVLFYPPFGMIDLDATMLKNISNIATIVDIDLRTGLATLKVKRVDAGYLPLLTTINAQVGINYQVSQVLNRGYGLGDLIDTAASAASSVGGLLKGDIGGIGGAISSVNNGVRNALASRIPTATTIGGTGSINSLQGTPTLQQEYMTLVEEDNENRGRPLCQKKTINTLSGYILVTDADIELPAMEAEQQEIRSYMEGGFFYE